MCYNVLCDKYCTRQIYGYCPSWALDWEYRKTAILKEILHYQADILGLQVMFKHSFCGNCFVLLAFFNNYQYTTVHVYVINQLNQVQESKAPVEYGLFIQYLNVKFVHRETTCNLGHAQVLK